MARNNDWGNEIWDKNKYSVMNPKHDHCTGFYFRCEACNEQLIKEQQFHGLCSDCSSDVYRGTNPKFDPIDQYYVENVLWSNPQGSIEEEFFTGDEDEGM